MTNRFHSFIQYSYQLPTNDTEWRWETRNSPHRSEVLTPICLQCSLTTPVLTYTSVRVCKFLRRYYEKGGDQMKLKYGTDGLIYSKIIWWVSTNYHRRVIREYVRHVSPTINHWRPLRLHITKSDLEKLPTMSMKRNNMVCFIVKSPVYD